MAIMSLMMKTSIIKYIYIYMFRTYSVPGYACAFIHNKAVVHGSAINIAITEMRN